MDEAALQSGHNRLGAIFNVQSHKNGAHVAFNRSLRDPQEVGDVLITIPTH